MDRLEEYEICQKRGHQPSSYVRGDGANRCKWCGTYYRWSTPKIIEDCVPKENNLLGD